jgi:hypothetical protein
MIALVAALLVAGARAESPAVEGAELAIPEPSATQAALITALSPRDGGAPCASLGGLSPKPVEDLTWVAVNITMPPWVGMRAAECLISDHHAAALPTLRTWVTDPQLEGFGILVLTKLDALPLATAKELATLALTQGPDVEKARKRIARSKVPEIQALSGLPAK